MADASRLGLAGAAAIVMLLASCASGPDQDGKGRPAALDGQIEAGRQIAVRECSACHAIDAEMKSPRPDAPPMLSILSRYDGDALANDLIQGVRVGHDDMPHFDFNIRAADSLVAYLRSIERTPRAAER